MTCLRSQLPKRLAAVCFSGDLKDVVVADTTGDVYRLPTDRDSNLRGNEGEDQHLILGHFSMLTDVAIRNDLIATADRDNKIRISRYPDSHIIESFLLGHVDFVCCVRWINSGRILSGSGDGSIRVWDTAGVELGRIQFDNEDTKQPPIITAVEVCSANSDIAAALLYGHTGVYILRGVLNGHTPSVALMLKCDGAGREPTGVAFDDKGILWVSRRCSNIVEGYRIMVERDTCTQLHVASMRFNLHTASIWNAQTSEHSRTFNRAEWLSQLRKKPIVDNWKGKKRKRSAGD